MKFPDPGIDVLELVRRERRPDREKVSHYASSLEGCPRKEYYKWIGAPVTNPASDSSRGKMDAGTDAHTLFFWRLKRAGVGDLQTEIAVEIEDSRLAYPLHGYIDGIFSPPSGGTYVVEYKSTQYRTTDRALVAPFTGALLQLWTYMKAYKADHYYIVYEDRGSKLGCEYEVVELEDTLYYRRGGTRLWTPAMAGKRPLSWPGVISKLAMIEQAVGDREPPERFDPITGQEYKVYFSKDGGKLQQSKTVYYGETKKVLKSHWMCMGYCSYRDHCWLGTTAEQAEVKERVQAASGAAIKGKVQPGQLSFNPKNGGAA